MNSDWLPQALAAKLYRVDAHCIEYAWKAGFIRSERHFNTRLVFVKDLLAWRRGISPKKIRGRREPLIPLD